MPNRSDVHIDKALTNLSVKYMQDSNNFIADKVFPIVPVMKQSDRYFMYKKEDWFRDDAQLRAPGAESAGGDYDIDNTPSYFCNKYAFHKDVTEEDRINSDSPLTPDQDATEFVVDKLLLNRENNWANSYFKSGIWAQDHAGVAAGTPGITYWDDYAKSDPITDIATMATAMAEVTGYRPNTLTLGRKVYDALRQHPDILDRIKFTQKGVVTTELLASLFDVDRILVANAIQNVAKKGKKADMEFTLGNNALLTYSPPVAGLKKASAGYIFSWAGLMGANALGGRINRFDLPTLGIGTERIECELAYDMKVVAKDLGAFVANAIDPNGKIATTKING
nr:MAG TPA: major capsid protein [Caudoviricetes sp.]